MQDACDVLGDKITDKPTRHNASMPFFSPTVGGQFASLPRLFSFTSKKIYFYFTTAENTPGGRPHAIQCNRPMWLNLGTLGRFARRRFQCVPTHASGGLYSSIWGTIPLIAGNCWRLREIFQTLPNKNETAPCPAPCP